ncbi:Uncharacterised protein [Klebsiella pneumoniae]|nr:Uncharacterised protein [Klebsiella pneumoniae]
MPANVTTSDIRELIAMTMISVAIELAQQASDLLSDETITASLSPDDISLIAGDARQAVQNAIDSVRSTWARRWRPSAVQKRRSPCSISQ